MAKGEVEKIKEVYERRRAQRVDELIWTILDPRVHFLRFETEREVLRAIRRAGLADRLASLQMLDVGCGDGRFLRWLAELGVPVANLHGLDLMSFHVARARELSPNMDVREGNAELLPYADASVDLVTQFGVSSSITDPQMRRRIADEMMRVAKPNATLLWWDARSERPRGGAPRRGATLGNPFFSGLSQTTVRSLFPNCRVEFRNIVINPNLTDRLARLLTFGPWGILRYKLRPELAQSAQVRYPLRYPYLLAEALKTLPFLHTHYLAVIHKEPSAGG